MSISRRQFLAASSALVFSGGAAGLWQRVALAAPHADQPGAADTILLVIEMSGGNDGLNTVIPFRDPLYAAARPQLKQSPNKVLKINDDLALHPALDGLAKLHERSELAIVQGVGYPNPNRSHFVSMDVWHTASLNPEEPFGWLGRGAEKMGAGVHGLAVGGSGSRALKGPTGRAASLRSLADYDLKVSAGSKSAARRRVVEDFAAGEPDSGGTLADQMKRAARETYQSVALLRQAAARYNTPVRYPSTGLAGRLKLVAQFIAAGVPERVYYTSLGGFDTHSSQEKSHPNLLTELGGAVAAAAGQPAYVRWNFFTDLTVTVGNTTWVRNGHLQ